MGKIFGISNLPVSSFMSPFEPVRIPKAAETHVGRLKNKYDVVLGKKNVAAGQRYSARVRQNVKNIIK